MFNKFLLRLCHVHKFNLITKILIKIYKLMKMHRNLNGYLRGKMQFTIN